MIKTLEAFGVPTDEWQQVILSSPAYQNGGLKHAEKKKALTSIEPKEIKMPDIFYFLKDAPASDEIAEAAREYLIDDRGVDPNDYPFMLSRKAENPKLHKWLGRVIMPIYKNNKLIFYIGRALYDAPKKYETPATPKERILYGFDRLFEHVEAPLIVVEGWFDGYAIDGVATLGNIITPYQRQWLDRSRREKIYVPDKFGDGRRAAEQAIEFGWSISTPEIGSDCKDMDDAVKKYGKLYVIKSIMENKTADEFEAAIQLGDYCDA
jgi:DNA primase